jgi:hypothetical protein
VLAPGSTEKMNFLLQDSLNKNFDRRASMDTNEGYTTKGSASSGVSSDLVHN